MLRVTLLQQDMWHDVHTYASFLFILMHMHRAKHCEVKKTTCDTPTARHVTRRAHICVTPLAVRVTCTLSCKLRVCVCVCVSMCVCVWHVPLVTWLIRSHVSFEIWHMTHILTSRGTSHPLLSRANSMGHASIYMESCLTWYTRHDSYVHMTHVHFLARTPCDTPPAQRVTPLAVRVNWTLSRQLCGTCSFQAYLCVFVCVCVCVCVWVSVCVSRVVLEDSPALSRANYMWHDSYEVMSHLIYETWLICSHVRHESCAFCTLSRQLHVTRLQHNAWHNPCTHAIHLI